AGSSDAPVITADPLVAIRDAVLRQTSSGRVLGPGERLGVRDALALYTTEAAFAMRREHDIGSLEPGKLADFVILDRSPLDTEPGEIHNTRVLGGVGGGPPASQADDPPLRLGPGGPQGRGPGRLGRAFPRKSLPGQGVAHPPPPGRPKSNACALPPRQ